MACFEGRAWKGKTNPGNDGFFYGGHSSQTPRVLPEVCYRIQTDLQAGGWQAGLRHVTWQYVAFVTVHFFLNLNQALGYRMCTVYIDVSLQILLLYVYVGILQESFSECLAFLGVGEVFAHWWQWWVRSPPPLWNGEGSRVAVMSPDHHINVWHAKKNR